MSTGLQIPKERQAALLEKLDDFHSRSEPTRSADSRVSRENGDANGEVVSTHSNGDTEESKSQLVLHHVLGSGKFSDEGEVEEAVEAYVKGKPLAYITGETFKDQLDQRERGIKTPPDPGLHTFGSLNLVVRPPVYIPRVETEQWVLLLVKKLLSSSPSSRRLRLLDICSGSGCIPLLLVKEGQGRIETVGLEVDDRALSVARENAKLNGIDHLSTFEQVDIFTDLQELQERIGSFDVVISNPPYVSAKDMKEIAGSWFEGNYALQGKINGGDDTSIHDGDDGLSFYRRIKQVYDTFLAPPHDRILAIPKVVLEVGATQSKPVQEMYAQEGRTEILKETKRRMSIGAPNLEKGDMVGTERCLWIYDV